MIKLGQEVKCKVTGFTGIATARVEYLNGCVQFCISPRANKDNKVPEERYVDIGQLEVVGKGVATKKTTKGPGGVMSNSPPVRYKG